jgi:hypothetical protein
LYDQTDNKKNGRLQPAVFLLPKTKDQLKKLGRGATRISRSISGEIADFTSMLSATTACA